VPARRPLLVPRVNANDETVLLRRWLVSHGTPVEAGTAIAELETTKAIVEVEAEGSGFLVHGLAAGEWIAVGEPLGWLSDAIEPADLVAPPPAAAARSIGHRLISRDAAGLIRENGLTSGDFPGDGPIRKRDVEELLARRSAESITNEDWARIIEQLPNHEGSTVIFGADYQGAVAFDCLEASRPGSAVVFVDDRPKRDRYMGIPVLPAALLARMRSHGIARAHVAIAAAPAKLACARRLKDAGFEIVQVRHPTACVSPYAKIGEGVFLGPLTLVGPEAVIEDYAQINNGASVAHHSSVGKAARLSDGVRLAGNVVISDGAFLGLGVTVNEGITIGNGTTVVSGVGIFDHIPPNSVVRIDGKAYPLRRETTGSSRREQHKAIK
jgi:UDP-perosamine 4-acetyltransferase